MTGFYSLVYLYLQSSAELWDFYCPKELIKTQKKTVSQEGYSLRKYMQCRTEMPRALYCLSTIWRVAKNLSKQLHEVSKTIHYAMGWISPRQLPMVTHRNWGNQLLQPQHLCRSVPCPMYRVCCRWRQGLRWLYGQMKVWMMLKRLNGDWISHGSHGCWCNLKYFNKYLAGVWRK